MTPSTITVITITFTKKRKNKREQIVIYIYIYIYGLIRIKEISLNSVRRSKTREERTFILSAINLPGKNCQGN